MRSKGPSSFDYIFEVPVSGAEHEWSTHASRKEKFGYSYLVQIPGTGTLVSVSCMICMRHMQIIDSEYDTRYLRSTVYVINILNSPEPFFPDTPE